MARDRESEIRHGVLFDRHNVLETARYCRARNGYLQHKAENDEAAAELLIADVLEQVQRNDYKPGQMFHIFNAWAVVDVPAPGSRGLVAGLDITDVRFHANFFVRPGRQPTLQLVESHSDSD